MRDNEFRQFICRARWLQSLDPRVKRLPWKDFCQLVLNRFGKAQYEALVRQMFNIRQTSSVQDYIDRFASLIDQLVAYGSSTDPVFFAMRFVDGLRSDIRNPVHMQRPQDFDIASVLVLLQEELQDPAGCKDSEAPLHVSASRTTTLDTNDSALGLRSHAS